MPNSIPRSQQPRGPERALKVIFAVVLIGPLLAWAILSYTQYQSTFAEARERTLRMADLLHEHALKVFETQDIVATQVDQILFGLSDPEIIARQHELWPRLKAIAEALDQLQDIWVIDAEGHPLIVTNFEIAPRGIPLADRTYFSVHLNQQEPPGAFYISEPLHGRVDPSLVFFRLSRRREVDGVFRGVTALAIEPDYFSTFYKSVAGGGFAALSLTRTDGTVLANYPKPDDLTRVDRKGPEFQAAIKAGNRGIYRQASRSGENDEIVAFRKLEHYPAYVLVTFDTGVAIRAWHSQVVSHLYFGIPAVLGLLVLIGFALRLQRREYASLIKLQAETQHRRELESQLHHAQRLESLGRLTGGVAHDFNNLLAVIFGSLELLRKRLPFDASREQQLVSRALLGAERGAVLVRRLMSFARQQSLAPERLDAHAALFDLADMARLSVGPSIEVCIDQAEERVWIDIDRSQFESALLNVCMNARDAMPDGGCLSLSAQKLEIRGLEAQQLQLAEGSYALICVRDQGVGMTSEVLEKAAEPFFTTKPPGQGTGLGLSQVHGFILQSGGKMQIRSAPGAGTNVRLILPLAAEPPTRQPVKDEGDPRASAGEIVLVVEDDMAVRNFTIEVLRSLGYGVKDAPTAELALTILSSAERIDAVLADIVMPGMDGWTLAEEIEKLHPCLPVGLMTGFDPRQPGHLRGRLVLRKPFTISELADAVRELVGARVKNAGPVA